MEDLHVTLHAILNKKGGKGRAGEMSECFLLMTSKPQGSWKLALLLWALLSTIPRLQEPPCLGPSLFPLPSPTSGQVPALEVSGMHFYTFPLSSQL